MIDRILKLCEVTSITGYKRSSIYRLMAQGQFPRGRKLGARSIGWRESEIRAWIDSRPTMGTN